jgi:predicted nucleic-acid-binding protein
MGRQAMKITADTNVLVRALVEDHARQSEAAQLVLREAEIVALTIPTLCELVWVLRGYKIRPRDIAEAIRGLLNSANVVVRRSTAEAGLAMLDAGGDFAAGVQMQHSAR